MNTCLGQYGSFRLLWRHFGRLSVCANASFPFCFEDGMWGLIVLIPNDCLPMYFGGGRVGRWCWVNFQCRGVLQFG